MKKAKRTHELNIGMALGVLASRECCSLQQALTQHHDYHAGIHDARRASRRLRSLLAFLAASSDPRPAAKADRTLKRLTRRFSGLRDAHVAVRTARRLAAAQAATLSPALIQQLEERSESLLAEALEQDPDWQDRRRNAARTAKIIAALDWQTIALSWAKDMLRHSIRRMKKARRIALEQRGDDAFHRWRRRTRQLRYQLEFMRKARHLAGMKKSHARQYGRRIRQLSLIIERLGWRQDFQVFLQTLDQLPASDDITASRAVFASAAAKHTHQGPVQSH